MTKIDQKLKEKLGNGFKLTDDGKNKTLTSLDADGEGTGMKIYIGHLVTDGSGVGNDADKENVWLKFQGVDMVTKAKLNGYTVHKKEADDEDDDEPPTLTVRLREGR